jgi:hypothetical protein
MRTHKAIALTSLVLTLAIVSPASALADAGGTDRPFKGTVSGTVSLHRPTGNFTADGAGINSHLGPYTAHLEGHGAPTPDGTLAGGGTITWVADNGDQLYGNFDLRTNGLPPADHTTTLETTINGGTGRFADASGKCTTTVNVHAIGFNPATQTLLSGYEGTTTGQISY